MTTARFASLGRGITNVLMPENINVTGDTVPPMSTSLNNEAIITSSGNVLSYGGNEMFDFSTVAKATYTHTGTGLLTWTGSAIATSNTVSSNASTATPGRPHW